jgi:hypothetical protein
LNFSSETSKRKGKLLRERKAGRDENQLVGEGSTMESTFAV